MTRNKYGIAELMSDFPHEECVARCEKARAFMDQEKIDGMLLAKADNIAYFSGWRRAVEYQFAYMMLPKKGPPVLVAPHSQRCIMEVASWIEDIRFFGPTKLGFSDVKETGLKVLKELGFADKVVGVESNPQTSQQEAWDAWTRGHLKKMKSVDELIWKMRMIKSPLELKYIRRSCDIICKAVMKGFGEIREGMTEREFARIIYRTWVDEGAVDSPLEGFMNLVGGASKYPMMDARPTDYKFRRGNMVLLDLHMTYKGYWSDIARLTCIGQPSKRQKQLFEAILEAESAGVEMLQPGRKVSEVCRVVKGVIEKRGMAKNMGVFAGTDWFGHSLGVTVHERPDIAQIRPDSDIVLEPGMVLAMEPALVDDPVIESMLKGYKPGGEGAFFVEDDVLITENGPENLTPIPRELNIV